MNISHIKQQLTQYFFPILEQKLPESYWKNLELKDEHLRLSLPFPTKYIEKSLQDFLKEQLQESTLTLELSTKILSHAVKSGLKTIPGVKNIIAVASGKGGVGKSTTSANLACALAIQGARVGLLDADIYGPNQPLMLGLSGKLETNEENKLLPKYAHGIQVMSIGFLIESEDTPMIWRGPMVSSALQQLLNDTAWDSLDYLIIDLPPGTGDIQLTLAQKIPVSGAVIITTPQDVALTDVRKAAAMFQKVRIPILGIIENMSDYVCSHCGHHEAIFGEGGAKELSKKLEIPLLGSLPLVSSIRVQADKGIPQVIAHPQSEITHLYHTIALKTAFALSQQQKDRSSLFPQIIIEKE